MTTYRSHYNTSRPDEHQKSSQSRKKFMCILADGEREAGDRRPMTLRKQCITCKKEEVGRGRGDGGRRSVTWIGEADNRVVVSATCRHRSTPAVRLGASSSAIPTYQRPGAHSRPPCNVVGSALVGTVVMERGSKRAGDRTTAPPQPHCPRTLRTHDPHLRAHNSLCLLLDVATRACLAATQRTTTTLNHKRTHNAPRGHAAPAP